ncbi:MAG: L-seryl-tRNA(Sec) selenium transferase, partial [Proteobacteria bacterium]|nr:L-seryl-tRNA(Sec) selenium transferase [Pseudomonadota bacterium]
MSLSKKQQDLLQKLPGIDFILENAKKEPSFANIPKSVLVRSARSVVEDLRTDILNSDNNIT